MRWRRRRIRLLALAFFVSLFDPAKTSLLWATERIGIASPNGDVSFHLVVAAGNLEYSIDFRGKPVIESSRMAMLLDGVNLSCGVAIGSAECYSQRDTYASRGVHSQAVNRCNGVRIPVTQRDSGLTYTLEVRAFDDSVAFRHVVPGQGERTPDEAHEFTFPRHSTLWYHGFHGHYEAVHEQATIDEVEAGNWSAPPLTLMLPNRTGYAAITEGGLRAYAGMGLEAIGGRRFVARLGHSQPVSHPFRLRFGEAEAERLARPAVITDEITTPWRIVMVGSDLDTLVNCDAVANVSAPPDSAIFPQGASADWLRPGRCVWKYLDGGESTLDGMREFSRLAHELGFEYNLVEGFWRSWTEDELRSLVDYSRELGVGILLWQHSGSLRTPDERREFFDLCERAGVAGVKIDFLDHEAKEIVDLYHVLLAEAAKRKLIVDFHGANKPAGESRTWPNEMTREAVFGLEMRRIKSRARHNVTLPFTRYLAGHADYTAVHFGDRRGNTTVAHQIASAAIFTSPLLVYGAHPQRLLDSPAVELIKNMPSTWDETRVLPQSEIGQLAVMARRRGDDWFLAIMNGDGTNTIVVPTNFLSGSNYHAVIVRDRPDNLHEIDVASRSVRNHSTIEAELQPGGGLIAHFRPR